MANPVMMDLVADTWTKVATSVKSCIVHIKNNAPRYVHTYRDTGDAAPTNDDESIGFSRTLLFTDTAESDLYIKAIGVAGEVRVDL